MAKGNIARKRRAYGIDEYGQLSVPAKTGNVKMSRVDHYGLIKKVILIQNKQDADGFFALAQPKTVPTNELVLRIWQQVG